MEDGIEREWHESPQGGVGAFSPQLHFIEEYQHKMSKCLMMDSMIEVKKIYGKFGTIIRPNFFYSLIELS